MIILNFLVENISLWPGHKIDWTNTSTGVSYASVCVQILGDFAEIPCVYEMTDVIHDAHKCHVLNMLNKRTHTAVGAEYGSGNQTNSTESSLGFSNVTREYDNVTNDSESDISDINSLNQVSSSRGRRHLNYF